MFERNQGVHKPGGQVSTGRGEPNTISHAVQMIPYAIQYYDEHGEAHATVAYKAGKIVYMDMNAERWAAGLRQASDFIREAVLKMDASMMLGSTPDTGVPQVDAVDVVSGETASDASDPTPS
jgi:hypothetical protein